MGQKWKNSLSYVPERWSNIPKVETFTQDRHGGAILFHSRKIGELSHAPPQSRATNVML